MTRNPHKSTSPNMEDEFESGATLSTCTTAGTLHGLIRSSAVTRWYLSSTRAIKVS